MTDDDAEQSKVILRGHVRDQITSYLDIFLQARFPSWKEYPTPSRLRLEVSAMRDPGPPVSPIVQRAYDLMDMFDGSR